MALLTHNTATDISADDAFRRTAPYVSTPLLTAPSVGGADVGWQDWVARQAYTTVDIGPYAGDASGPDSRPRAVSLATVTVTGRDGWRGPMLRYAVYCDLTAQDNGSMRVAGYELEPLEA
ncbi:hypothetical protein [Polymorphospora sp. NPDC050346]|uniref:hypothetical protein n=1 Tax=Polymorphospora sp. NPDC050346 TaxID=3155780 RepID=UPI0033F1839F